MLKISKLSNFQKILLLLLLLYMFFLSIQLMGHSLKFFGRDFAEKLIGTTSNPMVGLFIGILATSVIQSSSTTTSILVAMVAGNVISVSNAIPIVMGANIGTTITNTLVSMAHITRGQEFKRAFAASIVHDFFNIMAVAILLPLHLLTNYLYDTSFFLAKTFQSAGGLKVASPIKVITIPMIDVLEQLTQRSGIIMLILSVIILFTALKYIVTTIRSLVMEKIESFFDKYIFNNVLVAMFFGFAITSIVQSSSITTSLAIPLAGAGILTITQIFPYTLGTNVGTTVTALMAALATNNIYCIVVAFAHLIFNLSGIIVIWPIKRIPIFLAIKFAEIATKRKLYAILYIAIIFFIIPLILITIF